MAAVGALELAHQVGHVDQPLRAGLKVAQLHLARVELVADDDREMGALARHPLELAAERARGQVGRGCNPGGAQVRRQA